MKIGAAVTTALFTAFIVASCGEQQRDERTLGAPTLVSVDSTIRAFVTPEIPWTEEKLRAECPNEITDSIELVPGPAGGYLFILKWTYTGKEPSHFEASVTGMRSDGTRFGGGSRQFFRDSILEFRTTRDLKKGELYRVELVARPYPPHVGTVRYRVYTIDLRGL